jgi:hypothetical protein
MTAQERLTRNSLIIKYKLDNHTAIQTARKYNISLSQFFTIWKKYKQQHAGT